MLGITVADAVLVGTLLISLLAAWRGTKEGDKAKATRAPAPEYAIMGATMVDTDTFRDVAAAVRELTEVLRDGIAAQHNAAEAKLTALMEQIRDALREPPPPPRRRSPRGRG